MKRLGYACLTKTLDNVTSSSSLSYTNYLKNENKLQKLDEVIISNLEDLEKIIDYNIANDIHFYRLSSKIIPLATHKDVEFDYIDKYQDFYDRIGEKIKKSNMRVDFHPDQFCVLNSTNKDVVENSFRILEYHYNILEALKIEDKVIILHVGSNVFGKKQSIARFINNFEKLPLHIKECIVIENDDKVFNILDCLEISKKIKGDVGKLFWDASRNMSLDFAGDAWEKSLNNSNIMLLEDDKEALRSLGKLLGSTDIDGQLSQIRLVNGFLNEQIKEAIEQKDKNETMYKKLGIIVGLAVVIVLV